MSKPLSKGEQTRLHILETAAHLIYQQGYHHTGLQQILQACGVTKGAFYFHFRDKKSLALEIVDYFMGFFQQHLGAPLMDASRDPLAQLAGFHQNVCETFSSQPRIAGCPVGNLVLELAAQDPDFQQRLKSSLSHMTTLFERTFERGQAEECFTRTLPARALAEFTVNSWEGAVLRTKAEQSLAPLENWYTTLRAFVVTPAETGRAKGCSA